MADAPTLQPGDLLAGKYRIERVLGKGGMGVVVLATHVELEDRVAIKVLIGELDADAQQRFLREARAAAQIKSEHVARVHDVGTLPGGVPYMVMELLEGSDLAALLDRRGALPVPEAVGLVLEACVGLTEAHARSFVHRDIKPANLYLATRSDGRRVVKLLDFGISKATQDVSLTSTRAVLGTPAYMAPEQWRSAKDADVRSDIWSLGAVLYELLSGQRPFQGESVAEMCSAVLVEDPRPLAIGAPGLERIVARCLEKEPADRYQRIPELARDLAPFAADPEEASALVDRMDRVAGRPSAPSLPAPRSTGPTVVARPTAPAPAVPPAVATTQGRVPRRTAMIAIAATAAVAGAVTFALTRSSEQPTPGPTVLPQPGGTLRVAMNRADETHVALYAGQPTRTQAMLRMVLERLVVIDDAGRLQKSVLAGAETRDDGRRLVLALRDGVMFHDSPCMPAARATAADVKFSIEEAIAHHQLDLAIERMEAKGLELTIWMKTPALSFAHALSHVWLVPAKLADCERDRKALAHPVGSGPFKYVPSPVSSTLTLAKWDRYWRRDHRGAPLPYLDRIELVKVVEGSVALAGLHAPLDSAQALHVLIPSEPLKSRLVDQAVPKLIGHGTAGLELGTRTNQGDVGLWLFEPTPKPGPLHDHAVLRHAIALAIDRAAAVGAANRGASSPARPYGRFLPPEALGFDRTVEAFETSLERARRLIATLPPIGKLVIGYSHDRGAAEVVARSLAAIGLTVDLQKIEMRDQSAVFARGEGVDAMLISRWGKVLGDELISIGAYDQPRSTGTRRLLAELASKTQRKDREAVYKQIEATLMAELPSIPIATLDPSRVTFATIVRKEVEGFHDRATGFVPHDDRLTFAETWLRRPAP